LDTYGFRRRVEEKRKEHLDKFPNSPLGKKLIEEDIKMGRIKQKSVGLLDKEILNKSDKKMDEKGVISE
jgi:hypothetical protein